MLCQTLHWLALTFKKLLLAARGDGRMRALSPTKSSTEGCNAALADTNLILGGGLPRHGSLLDATLVGLQKQDCSVRPIAVGETWYRITRLC